MPRVRIEMKHLLSILILALTCATLHAQSVIVKATGAWAVHRSGTGAGSVRGVAVMPATYTNYSDGQFTVFNTNQNVVVDNYSGLTWVRNASTSGESNWNDCTNYCESLTYSGYDDWRLPSLLEFSKTVATNGLLKAPYTVPALPSGHPFTGSIGVDQYYWTSTDVGDGKKYYVYPYNGYVGVAITATLQYAWPCRGP